MITALARRILGTPNDRTVKAYRAVAEQVNALEPETEALSDEALRARTDSFRERIENGETLDDLLVEAFATVREAAKRSLGQRHYDVQLVGGMVLHDGKIAEMKTGEGKTLVATLAVYLNALSGDGVHVVTVNDYLAPRDAEWMGQVYRFLGLEVGCIVAGMSTEERRVAYAADVTYGTNNEFGFDYLRDNMKFTLDEMVQRTPNFAIVDEVDSILIDEARTPLIISGPTEDNSELYTQVDKLIPKLGEDDFEIDEKAKKVTLTETGAETMETILTDAGLLQSPGLYDYQNITIVHHVNQALNAHKLFDVDTDYIVKDGKVVIIDEFTGRMMEGRRYSNGQHQALEAKEGVNIENENQTLASITFQNYFRLYPKLSGMTGTAATEAAEFGDIYGLLVVEIPTHVDMIRKDNDDEIYRTADEKVSAMVDQIEDCRKRNQPILVGTTSIAKSEELADHLKKKKIPHNVLNARYHEQEAHIIAQAGRLGAVTIATNMAGRGTDIQLGGNLEMRLEDELDGVEDEKKQASLTEKITAEVQKGHDSAIDSGGLYVIGSERHESRRIDNQLRGRSGRQGDPGGSKFFLSLEDDLMRIFGSERMDTMLRKLGLEEGEAIFHPWINKALEKAQQKVESFHYESRKNILRFDDVMNDQRKVIYAERIDLMAAEDVSDSASDMRSQVIEDMIPSYIAEKAYAEQWDISGLHEEILRIFGLDLPLEEWAKEEGIAEAEIEERIKDHVERRMAEKAVRFGTSIMRQAEKSLMLQILDQLWKDHLLSLDHLRQGIGLRAYGQRDPLNEYKREAFEMFEAMLTRFRETVTTTLAHVEIQAAPDPLAPPPDAAQEHPEPASAMAGPNGAALAAPPRAAPAQRNPRDPSTWGKVGRNETCPCGTGKKYKHCHGKVG
jgi:preprotein translocase subunit SecA